MGLPVRLLTEQNKADIRRLVSYDPETGAFFNKIDRRGVGKFRHMPAGTIIPTTLSVHGYAMIGIASRLYSAHRVAWFLATGEWSGLHIDHIDHVRTNNKFENLRCVNPRANKMNETRRKDNSSGCTGVSFDKRLQKWRAYYYANTKNIHLGFFEDKQDAIDARLAVNADAGFHPNHGMPRVATGAQDNV